MRSYVVIYEKAQGNFSAYVPDLPGCVACGDTMEETQDLMKVAIELYLEALEEEGSPIPEPVSEARNLAVG